MQRCSYPTISRRRLLAGAGVFAAWAAMPKVGFAGTRDPRLVVVILRGALDGLAAVAPIGDPNYRSLRGALALGEGGRDVLPLGDGFFALNDAMPKLAGYYREGEATIVHAAATPYRDRSHFDGQNVLESGLEGPSTAVRSGWLNRVAGALPAGERVGTSPGLAIGPTIPLILAGPAALAGGVVQINLLVGRQVASFSQEGALQYLNLADRLYQLPLGVVAIAIGIVLLPDLSRRLQAGDGQGARDAYNRACEFALLLTVPAAVALVVIPEQLISFLFQRGAFTPEDTQKTALAVMIYGLGLPAFVMQKVLQPLYFAREDTKTPFRFAIYAMIINALVAVGLSFFIGYLAAAVATTVAAWGMVALLWFGKKAMGEDVRTDARLLRRAPRILIASLLMGALLWGSESALSPIFALSRGLGTLLLVAIGIVGYFTIAHLIGAVRMAELKGSMRRSR